MESKVSALVLHAHDDRLITVSQVLDVLPAKVLRARNCREAAAHLCHENPPDLVLTDSVLPDGNWLDVLDLSAKALKKVKVIVVSRVADIKLYVDVMNNGAFDFITESFTVPEIIHVLRCAMDSHGEKRQQLRVPSSHCVEKQYA